MSSNNKTEEFLQKLAPCIERGELEECVEEAARIAREMGMGATELLGLSRAAGMSGRHDYAYTLSLAAVRGLEGKEKAIAYYNAGLAAQSLGKLKISEKHYQLAIEANPNLAEVHGAYGLLLIELDKTEEAWKKTEKASEIFKESGRVTYSHLAKVWFYLRCADKNLERTKYRESSEDIYIGHRLRSLTGSTNIVL